MIMKENKTVVPFDSFSAIYKIILWAGYSKLDDRAKTWKKILYEIYRRLALTIILSYFVQLLIYTWQSGVDIDRMPEGLALEILHSNLIVKALTMFFLDMRLHKLNEFLKDGIFGATNEAEQKILQVHVKQMHRLSKYMNINTCVAALSWALCSVLKRYMKGEYEVIPMYIPFRTDTVFRFFLLLVNQVGPMLWIGNGHTSLDLLIATYYAQAHTQLRIIREQLNNLLDETENDRDYLKYEFQYKDLPDNSVTERLIKIVKRYGTLMWYVKEVDAIFNVTLSYQFLSSSLAVCFVTYGMTSVSTSFQFIFMIILFIFFTTQIFLYCIFGNLVFFESQLLNESLYKSEWLLLSPPFRRQLLIPMAMWSKPVQPTVCRILPLSLRTFFTIIKASYTLFTVLKVVTKE